jgi:hypothetical protein
MVSDPEPSISEYATVVEYVVAWNKWNCVWVRRNVDHSCTKTIPTTPSVPKDDTDQLWGAAVENLRDATFRMHNPNYKELRAAAIACLTALRIQMNRQS